MEAYKKYWEISAPRSYKDLNIGISDHCPGELSLPRHLVAHIYAARSGHGDFASYHLRLSHTNANTHCSCGEPKSTIHFLECSLPTIRAPKALITDPNITKFLLKTHKGAIMLVNWLEGTKFFSALCPRFPPKETIVDTSL